MSCYLIRNDTDIVNEILWGTCWVPSSSCLEIIIEWFSNDSYKEKLCIEININDAIWKGYSFTFQR